MSIFDKLKGAVNSATPSVATPACNTMQNNGLPTLHCQTSCNNIQVVYHWLVRIPLPVMPHHLLLQ